MAVTIKQTLGTYYLPYASREGDQTAKQIESLCTITSGGAADADHTLSAFTLSGTSDFVVDYIMINAIEPTSTARYQLLICGETVATWQEVSGTSSIVEILEFTKNGVGGLRVTGQTSTAPIIQFVSSNAAATAGAKLMIAQGHWV